MPLARDVVKDLAVEHGACIRPVQLRRTDLSTGETMPVLVPCGNTLASVCPPCAERARNLRAAQCREGWHLEREPVIEPDDADRRTEVVDREARRRPGDARHRRNGRRRHGRPGRAARRTGRGNQRRRNARQRAARPAATAAPLDQAAAGCPATAQTERRSADSRQDLHRAGRQDLPPVPVRHPHLPVLRARHFRGDADRPGHLRLHALRRGTRSTSPRCSTGSSRTFAGSAASTSSTSPRSSRNDGSRRTST